MDLSGVHVPLVTPFDNNGVVDTKSIAHITEVMIANGISGIVAAGTTGEAYALNFDEEDDNHDYNQERFNRANIEIEFKKMPKEDAEDLSDDLILSQSRKLNHGY